MGSSIGDHGGPAGMANDNPILSNFDPEMGSLVDAALQQSPEGKCYLNSNS